MSWRMPFTVRHFHSLKAWCSLHHHGGNTIGPTCAVDRANHIFFYHTCKNLLSTESSASRIVSVDLYHLSKTVNFGRQPFCAVSTQSDFGIIPVIIYILLCWKSILVSNIWCRTKIGQTDKNHTCRQIE